jgi:hypothetical protein
MSRLFYLFGAGGAGLLFFISVPGTLFLRASCFTLRLCVATPLEGRLALVFTAVSMIALLL